MEKIAQVKSIKKSHLRLFLLIVLFMVIFLFSFFLGKFPIAIDTFFQVIWESVRQEIHPRNQQVATILFQVRFPRILMAAVIGMGISVAGATYQALFQNPMISQDILGTSQGAAFGAAIALYFSLRYEEVVGLSFVFGLIAVALVLLIDRYVNRGSILNLILIGMMVGSLFSAAVSFLKLVSDTTNTLPAITYWLMGSLSSIKQQNVYYSLPIIVVGMLPIFLFRWRLNVLSLGEEEAQTLGLNTKWLRLLFIFSATLITAAAVSVSGMIGWVGLVVPHFARLLIGNDYRYSIPATAVIGGAFLLLVDDFARLITTSEIPIGILTSFIGAPIFILLLIKNNRMGSH